MSIKPTLEDPSNLRLMLLKGRMERWCFFDLDGTLADPGKGITQSLAHAFRRLDVAVPSKRRLNSFVGTGLREIFAEVIEGADDALIDQGIDLFRERFDEIGVRENTLYEGVAEVLSKLRAEGFGTWIVTMKPQIYVAPILKELGIDHLFDGLTGAGADERDTKFGLLKDAMKRTGADPKRSMMVGDRSYDVDAAKDLGLVGIGATYGMGTQAELASADHLIATPIELLALPGVMKLKEPAKGARAFA